MSFLARVHRATRSSLADYPDPDSALACDDHEAARAEGFAAENARIAERVTAIRADRFIADNPARLAAALALAPASISIAEIKTRVAGVFDPQTLAAADQTGSHDAAESWSRVIAAAQPEDTTTPSVSGVAVASGGPFPAHPSANLETL